MTVSFVHLRVHTEYSLVDGLVRVKPLIKAVAGAGMPAVAVTDMSNMCSLVKFYKTAMGGGVKPICGADLWLASREEDGPLSRLTLLAMDAGVGPRGFMDRHGEDTEDRKKDQRKKSVHPVSPHRPFLTRERCLPEKTPPCFQIIPKTDAAQHEWAGGRKPQFFPDIRPP